MIIGVPKERKIHEYRVAATPHTVRVMVDGGNAVLIEQGAGNGSGITDKEFVDSGAEIVSTNEELFSRSELIVKVKELQKEEFSLLTEKHILFSYIHLAAEVELCRALIDSGARVVAYETVELDDGSLPLLRPMSRIAGQLSIHVALKYLQKTEGGKGLLISGAPGVRNGKVTVIGGGAVGYNATISALGLKADVTLIDIDLNKLKFYYEEFEGIVKTYPSYPEIIEREIASSDIVVGAVLVTGARAPRVITRDMLSKMEEGSVFVDVAIDQGGCAETSRPTTLDAPAYKEVGVTHYCATNIPSLVSKTSTYSLSITILPYVLKLAEGKLDEYPPLRRGINVDRGELVLQID